MQYIATWREGDRISEIFLCKNKTNCKTKAGRTYYSLVLQDKTATADGKIWDLSSGIDHFESMQYIRVEGEVTLYQGSLQLNIRRARVAREGEYSPADYLPVSEYSIDDMFQKLLGFVKGIKNEKLRRLLELFFVEDAALAAPFKSHSAAKSVHHGFVGGLLQHTLRVAELCDFYCRQYPALNRDLLMAGALLHDIGKTHELAPFPENDYTDAGQLLGHIVIGSHMIMERAARIPGFPKTLLHELCHLILAHHGEYEFGSPKKPALIEAMALHHADNTDAKLQTMTELLSGGIGTEWMGYQRLLDSNVRRTTPSGE